MIQQNHNVALLTINDRVSGYVIIEKLNGKDANENTNGVIRQYFPKKTSFENLSDLYIKRVEDILNNRPRKKLNLLIPIEFLLLKFA